jgi:putative ABC transport system permease protein
MNNVRRKRLSKEPDGTSPHSSLIAHRSSLPLRLIAFIGLIVPRRLRAEWRREWEAEMHHRAALLARWHKLDLRHKLDLLRRSLWAFRDALLLQPKRLEDEMFQDLRYGIRILLKHKGFTAVVLFTLALGIGANTAIFSVVDAVLLRPLPYPAPEQLVRVWGKNARQAGQLQTVSLPDYLDWSRENKVFERMGAFTFVGGSGNLVGPFEGTERVSGLRVTANLFPLLGANVALGRLFLPEDEQAGAAPVVLLSHRLWSTRFGSNPQTIGQSVTLSGRSFTVVGVMRAGFQHPGVGGSNTDIWRPLVMDADQMRREARHLQVVARLQTAGEMGAAQARMESLARSLEQQYPKTNAGYGIALVPLHETVIGEATPALNLLLGAVGFVLLIACANVANLLLSRAAARQKEMAVRMALGAGRFRLVRQLLTESLLLATFGGAIGLLLARLSLDSLVALSADKLPRADQIEINGSVLFFNLTISVLTGLLFGLVPAFHATRQSLQSSLKAGGISVASTFSRSWLRNFLVISEITLAMILLVGAGLLIRSVYFLQQVDPGLNPQNVLTMRVALPAASYSTGQRRAAFYQELLQRVSAIPGVRAAGVTTWLPNSGQRFTTRLSINGRPATAEDGELSADYRVISPNYLRALGASLLQGRELSEQDNEQAPLALIINESLAKRYWPDEVSIGKRMTIELGKPYTGEVVGVIKDIKEFGPAAPPTPVIYGSYLQSPWLQMETRELVVRTSADPLQPAAAIRHEVRAMDKEVPAYNIIALDEWLDGAIAQPLFSLTLLGLFAAIAFAMAIAGLYAVVAYAVAQRTHEIGIRLALGAQTSHVLKIVIGQGMRLTMLGITIGLLASFGLTRLMKAMLFGVNAADPLTLAAIACLLTLIAFLACLIPARRAMRIEPLVALRGE